MWNRVKVYISVIIDGFRCLTERFLHPKAAYLVLTPEHGNLGDHAIAQAEKELFSHIGIKIIEVSGKELRRRREHGGLTRLMNGRPILVHGGGYLGTLWFNAELLLRDVIKRNPRSNIVLLPNTVYYEDTIYGNEQFAKSVDVYNSHRNLVLYTRERSSYEKTKSVYNDVRLMPDMVMYMNKCSTGNKRAGCILCLRADHEKTRTEEAEKTIIQQVTTLFNGNVTCLDMCKDYSISIADRDKELEKQYNAFKNSELVVTDRLHGMIFSAITGTPCIFIDSKSPKVKGCYEWLKHLDYIRFCEDPSNLSDIYYSMPKGDQCYDNSELMPYFEKLANDVKTIVRMR